MAQGRRIPCGGVRAHRRGGVHGVPRGGGPGQVQGRMRCNLGEPHGRGAAASDREGVLLQLYIQ